MNLDSIKDLTLEELVSLKSSIDRLISKKQVEQKKSLINEFKEKAAKLGLSLEDVMGADGGKSRKTKGQKVAPKYQNPADPSQTWTGRGRKPLWVEAELKSGKTLEDLAI